MKISTFAGLVQNYVAHLVGKSQKDVVQQNCGCCDLEILHAVSVKNHRRYMWQTFMDRLGEYQHFKEFCTHISCAMTASAAISIRPWNWNAH